MMYTSSVSERGRELGTGPACDLSLRGLPRSWNFPWAPTLRTRGRREWRDQPRAAGQRHLLAADRLCPNRANRKWTDLRAPSACDLGFPPARAPWGSRGLGLLLRPTLVPHWREARAHNHHSANKVTPTPAHRCARAGTCRWWRCGSELEPHARHTEPTRGPASRAREPPPRRVA